MTARPVPLALAGALALAGCVEPDPGPGTAPARRDDPIELPAIIEWSPGAIPPEVQAPSDAHFLYTAFTPSGDAGVMLAWSVVDRHITAIARLDESDRDDYLTEFHERIDVIEPVEPTQSWGIAGVVKVPEPTDPTPHGNPWLLRDARAVLDAATATELATATLLRTVSTPVVE